MLTLYDRLASELARAPIPKSSDEGALIVFFMFAGSYCVVDSTLMFRFSKHVLMTMLVFH